MQVSRRDALATGAAAIVTGAAVAPLAIKATATKAARAGEAEDAELIALGQQWIDAYGEWIGTEDEDSTLLKRCRSIEDKMAEIPARSGNGALVKLRVAAEHYRLMGDIDDSLETRLTYQAWQALETQSLDFERLMRGAPS